MGKYPTPFWKNIRNKYLLMDTILQYEFGQNALLAAIFASISCGIIGTYIVAKRIVFISGGITHASFGGIGIGYYLGINPIIGAMVFGVISALGMEFFTKKVDMREDSAIAMLWALGMAVGIIFVYLTPGYAPNLLSYLFGNILMVSYYDLLMMFLLTVAISVFFIFSLKMILFVSFDEEFARINNAPVKVFNMVLMGLVALTIVFNIKVVGIILVMSLLTIPQAIANIFTRTFAMMMVLSVVFAFIGSVSGLILSYKLDIPSGAAIIFSLILLFLIIKTGSFFLQKQRRAKI
jgi:zinc transport system permease protein